jgi:hypothetical protein
MIGFRNGTSKFDSYRLKMVYPNGLECTINYFNYKYVFANGTTDFSVVINAYRTSDCRTFATGNG